ncbi:desmethyl-deoxy-podophyllotoxin synthase-like [Cornus florida]|uniref:desmethyl-deoxy-podophyllotoxin synthase-like n=1 Tax=Cornus florida TaxID=4283 RepID=UPI00289AADB3|nr:desmethyl-deoxy-podophyllotoxin synthase-like [Cornus florida]
MTYSITTKTPVGKKFDGVFDKITDEHKAKKVATKSGDIDGEADQEDLVDVLLRVQEKGNPDIPLDMTTVKAVILDMFIAGVETSSTTLIWAMLVIKETLKIHTLSALLLPRKSCEINGHDIPAKTQVIVNAWVIARDPENWSDLKSFQPERLLDSSVDYKGTHFQYTPFGAGRRIFPGMSFRIANIELPLANLLYHFEWKLPDGEKQEDLDMTEVFGAAVGRKRDLCVILIPYHPSA